MYGSTKDCIKLLKACLLMVVLAICPINAGGADQSRVIDKTMQLNGISFHVICPNEGSLNTLTIVPAGLTIDNSTVTQEIDGSVTGVDIADLNADGSPEIYVYISSAGSGSYGSLVAYSSNNNKSMSGIYLPPLEEDAENSQGYMGHDEFSLMKGSLVRRFPIYKKNDTNAHPTGGMRQLQYALVAGEANWVLQVVRSTVL